MLKELIFNKLKWNTFPPEVTIKAKASAWSYSEGGEFFVPQKITLPVIGYYDYPVGYVDYDSQGRPTGKGRRMYLVFGDINHDNQKNSVAEVNADDCTPIWNAKPTPKWGGKNPLSHIWQRIKHAFITRKVVSA